MKRRIHRSACAVLALIALSLTGATTTECAWKTMAVEIPDLEANQIDGLQLWRADDETGVYLTEAGRIVFGELTCLESGSETLAYTMLSTDNEPIEENGVAALGPREEGNDSVTLHFLFTAWSEPPGWIRVTTFNAAGESELSEEAVFL